MALVSYNRVGAFCWAELCTSNWQEAKAFYMQLFDWGFDDQPIGEGAYYTMLQKQGDDVAAMYQMMPQQKEAGAQSQWLSYIAVENVDEMADRAQALGAEIIAGPHDVPEAGRMVMLQEPADGAHFALWQAKEHPGCRRELEANVPYWFELATRSSQKSRAFYSALLGWQAQDKPMEGMDYVLFSARDTVVAGMLQMSEEWGDDIPAHWMTYFAVMDCDAMADKARTLGGQVCVPPTDIPQVGRFAVITDPQGAVFSIIQSQMHDIEP